MPGNYDNIQVPVSGQPASASLFGTRVRDAIIALDTRTSEVESAIGGGAQEVGDGGNSSAFSITTPTDSSPILGFSFIAPRSGRIQVWIHGGIQLTVAGQIFMAPRVRTGTTLGAGTVVLDPAVEPAIKIGMGVVGILNAGAVQILSGLVPGDPYNLTAVHWCASSGTGLYLSRKVGMNPLPS